MMSKCDYCDKGLGSAYDSTVMREYWTNQLGLVVCDSCLLHSCDNFRELPESSRIVALRLLRVRGINLETIDATIERARPVISPSLMDKLECERAEIFELHTAGELVAAMRAGQAFWNDANHLNESLTARPIVRTGEKVRRPFKEANEGRARTAIAKYAEWQNRACQKWAEPLHRDKSAAEIARLIALPGEKPDTIRRHIKK